MEGCGTWTDLLNGCLGRRHKTEDQAVELTPQANPYGRKLMDRLEEDAAKGVKAVGRSQAGLPKGNPQTDRAALHSSGQPRRPSSQDLGNLVNSSENTIPMEGREHDNAWYEMLDSLHIALKHTRYSVSGRMAMSVWGCSRGARDALSVICPVESKEAVKIWAVTTGGRFSLTDAEPDILSFQSQISSQPRLWRVRIRWLPERMFEAMPMVEKRLTYNENPYTGEYRNACVNVLTLPALLDNSASAWMDNLAKGITQERLEILALDIHSILDCIVELNFQEEGSGPLSAAECRHVLTKAFWIPFTQRYPLAPVKFAQCGLGLPSYTQSQPGPHGGMVYAAESTRHSAAEMSTKDAGRNLMVRKPTLECHSKTAVLGTPTAEPEDHVQKPSFRDLFITASREQTAEVQLERERRNVEDARRLEEQICGGARKLGERERDRKRERRVRWEDNEEKMERKKSKRRRTRPRRSASVSGPSSSSMSVRRSATVGE